MILVKGMDLNIEKSSNGTNNNQWLLYFNRGYFVNSSETLVRSTDSNVLKLKKSNYVCEYPCGYHVYYNPDNNKFSIIDNQEYNQISEGTVCHDYGYSIGGFIVHNCKLNFVYPKDCDIIEYQREFAPEFDESYNKQRFDCNTSEEELAEICGTFNDLNFNNDYDIDCIVYENSENEFNACQFDNQEFEADPEEGQCQIP